MKTIISIICVVLSLIVAVFFSCDKENYEETTIVTESTTVQWLPPGYNDASQILEQSATLGEFCENADYKAQCSYWMSYKQKGKETDIYSIGVSVHNLIDKLISDNYDKKAETRQSTTDEALVFESSVHSLQRVVTTRLCSDGYLYISCKDTQGNDVTRAFNIGTDSYSAFMNEFHKGSCIWTPEHPVTIG